MKKGITTIAILGETELRKTMELWRYSQVMKVIDENCIQKKWHAEYNTKIVQRKEEKTVFEIILFDNLTSWSKELQNKRKINYQKI